MKNKYKQLVTSYSNGDKNMFKKILKTIMLAQAASAARKTLRYLSDRDLDDMGSVSYTHLTLPTTPYV